jgi:IS1 family transposase
MPRYRCHKCKRTFNARSATAVARLWYRERWQAYAQCLRESLTVRASAKAVGIRRNAAWRWRQRFLSVFAHASQAVLEGLIEADETYLNRSHKGSRNLHRPAHRRGSDAAGEENVCVLAACDRAGRVRDGIVEKCNEEAVNQVLWRINEEESVLCSDGHPAYEAWAKAHGVIHKRLNIRRGIRIIDGIFHIQNVNGYHSRLKAWLGRFHGVSTRYLGNYLAWRRVLEEKGGNVPEKEMLLRIIRECQQEVVT